jgi:elongation factor G
MSMKAYEPKDVRVVGFFGHRGSGKTSLIEAMLYNSGATNRLGSVDAGNLALEIDEGALDRQMTMQVNAGFLEHAGARFSILDTPGDGNFWGSAFRALHVVDGAVLTVSAPDGMEPITLRAIGELEERRIPYAIVVTKLDKEQADFETAVSELKADLNRDAVAISIPIGKGADFKGVVSLLSQKAYVVDGDKTTESAVPADMADEVAAARELLFDAVAAADDELMEKFLEEGSLTEEELARGLKGAVTRGALVPVLAANPTANIGSRVVTDLIAQVFPSPLERPAVKGYKSAKGENPVERMPEPSGPLVAQVFRTYYDPFAGMLSFARVWSGKLGASGEVYNVTQDTGDRPSHLYLPQGGTKNAAEIKEAGPGDIIVLTKLKSTATGDTLTAKDDPTFLPPFEEPEALLNYGIHATDKKNEDKLNQMIQRICEEDPSLNFHRDPDTHEPLLGGLGQAHIDYVVDRLKRIGIVAALNEPKVPYRESFRGKVQGIEGKHKKQTGGAGQFGVCFIHAEPLPRGSGEIEFVDQVVGGSIPRQFIPSVEKGVREALKRGPLSGSPVVDLKVIVYDGKYHPVDSKDVAFQIAGRKAIRELYGHKGAKPVLLEPYMSVDVMCPADNVGDVMGDLNSRRARVNNMTTEGRRGHINASVPMAEMLKYTNILKSITSGRGSFTMRFDRYEEAPAEVQAQVAAAYEAGDDED